MSHEESIAKRWGGRSFSCPDWPDEPEVRREPLWCGCCLKQVEEAEYIKGIYYCEACLNQGIEYENQND